MARDLIPPLSPAGRPMTPDGTPNLIELPPEPRPAAEPSAAAPNPGPSEFRNRFGFLLGALGGVFIVAVAVAVIVIVTNRDSVADAGLAPNWSEWKPADTSIEQGAKEIAAHVGAEYTHPDGRQLVEVSGGEFPSDFKLMLRPSSGPIATIDGTRIVYQLDGLGPNGTIKGGEPSATRLKVIQREALELALYTFRYLPDAESVMMLLPPPPPSKEQQAAAAAAASAAAAAAATGQAPTDTTPPPPQPAMFYRPGDLKPQLQMPLSNTLDANAPSTDSYSGPEADTVETLTMSNRFNMSQPAPGRILLDRSE